MVNHLSTHQTGLYMYCQFVCTCNKYIQLVLYTLYILAHLLVYTHVIVLHSYIQFVLAQRTCSNYTHSLYVHVHKFQMVYMYYTCVTHVYTHSLCLDVIHVYSSIHVFTYSSSFHTEIKFTCLHTLSLFTCNTQSHCVYM